MRQKRLTQEPAGDCFLINVLLEDNRGKKQLIANSLQIKQLKVQ